MQLKLFLSIALILNLILSFCEIYALGNVKGKINILKYYTFLQNFLALIVSVFFSVYLFEAIFLDRVIPEFVKGLRYVATCGLMATTLIFVLFLSSKNKNILREEDFVKLSPAKANYILHFFCPLVSLFSFVIFERKIPLTTSVWTLYAAIPSCLYWIIYLILSAASLWEEPYDFSTTNNGKKGILAEVFKMILIPLSFILVSFVLWNIK